MHTCLLHFLYDGKAVTFHYNRHEDEKYIQETVPVLDFIKRLIRHIPEKHFKQVRYYGIYANPKVYDKVVVRKIPKQKIPILHSFLRWRESLYFSFGIDPLKCNTCKTKMTLLGIFQKNTYFTIYEILERTLWKHKEFSNVFDSS